MKLRETRARKLLSAKELARQAGVSESNIYAIEHGGWLPSLSTVRKLASVLGIDPLEVTEFKDAIEKSAINPNDSWAFKNLLTPQNWEDYGDNLAKAAYKLETERERPIVNHIYFMLIGFALENYYKGAIILLKGNYLKAGNIYDLKSHDLSDLAGRAGLDIKDDIRTYLDQLTEDSVWRGRYPTPLIAGDINGKIRFSPASDNRGSLQAPYSLELTTTITTDEIHELIDQAKSNLDSLNKTIKTT